MGSIRLSFDGFVVDVAAEAADLRWLAAFLACGFDEVPDRGDAADARVSLSVDPAACRRLVETARAGGGGEPPQAEGFAGDARGFRFESLGESGRSRLYRDPRKGILYRVSDDLRRVEIVAPTRQPKLRRALMRLVRELAMGRCVAEGGLLLHASAVHHAGGVVAICGPKRSGKTTLLRALLRIDGVHYLANDRCALRWDGARGHVRGIPTLVSIRDPDGGEHPGIEPPAFCAGLTAPPRAAGRLTALVFPRIVQDPGRMAVRRLTPPEAIPRLRAGLFRAGRERVLGEVFTSPSEPAQRCSAPELLRPLERRIADAVPCFECRLGGGALPDTRHARALLDALRAAERTPAGAEALHA